MENGDGTLAGNEVASVDIEVDDSIVPANNSVSKLNGDVETLKYEEGGDLRMPGVKSNESCFPSMHKLQEHQNNCLRTYRTSDSEPLPSASIEPPPTTNFRITGEMYLCSACGTCYENCNLFLHMREVHNRHICLYCLGMFTQADKLSVHLTTKHGVREQEIGTPAQFLSIFKSGCVLMCDKCEQVFTEKDEFHDHACSDLAALAADRACFWCGLQGTHFPTCRRAYNGIELQPTITFKCFPSMHKLQEHQNNCLRTYRTSDPEPLSSASIEPPPTTNFRITGKVYLCTACGTYYENWNLFLHMREVHNRHICLYCLGMFTQADKLSVHLTTKHGVREQEIGTRAQFMSIFKSGCALMCDTCEQVFIEKDEFHDHACRDLAALAADRACFLCGLQGSHSPTCRRAYAEMFSPPQINATRIVSLSSDTIVPLPSEYKLSSEETRRMADDKEQTEDPSENIQIAGDDVPVLELTLEENLDILQSSALVKECVQVSCSACVFCNHAKKIAVNGKQLILHLLAEHRFKPVVSSDSGELTVVEGFVERLKTALSELQDIFFNTDSYDSSDKTFSRPYDGTYECFHCNFITSLHKELYVHNRKMHQKTILLCIMCKSNFYSYSELLCHLCPGIYVSNSNITFRCCLCEVDGLPSALRLMFHLRKRHHACDVCLEATGDQQKLSNHVRKHKLDHICYRCGIAYRNKLDITKHLFWKHGTESVLCKKCLQKKWIHVYHFCIPPNAFVCEECNASFSTAVALRAHRRWHRGEFPYGCNECDERFTSRKLLAKHRNKHQQSSVGKQSDTVHEGKRMTNSSNPTDEREDNLKTTNNLSVELVNSNADSVDNISVNTTDIRNTIADPLLNSADTNHNYCLSTSPHQEKKDTSAASLSTPSKKKQKSPKKKRKHSGSCTDCSCSSSTEKQNRLLLLAEVALGNWVVPQPVPPPIPESKEGIQKKKFKSKKHKKSQHQHSNTDRRVENKLKLNIPARRERRKERAKKKLELNSSNVNVDPSGLPLISPAPQTSMSPPQSLPPSQSVSSIPPDSAMNDVVEQQDQFINSIGEDEDFEIKDSDLDRDKPKTDEEFYDKYPQKPVSRILTEKQNQLLLLAEVALGNWVVPQPVPTPIPETTERMLKRTSKSKKHKKSQHQHSNTDRRVENELKLNISPSYYNSPTVSPTRSLSPLINPSKLGPSGQLPRLPSDLYSAQTVEPSASSITYHSTGSGSDTVSRRSSKRKKNT